MVSKLTLTFEFLYRKLRQNGNAPNIYSWALSLVIMPKSFLNNIDFRTIMIIDWFQYEIRIDVWIFVWKIVSNLEGN